MRTLTSRAIATAAAAAIALTTLSLQPAAAGPYRGDDAAALGAFAAVFGTIAAIIAAEQYRDQPSYEPSYGYGPVYRGGPVHGPHGYWQHHR
jgi:hypothetical protein